MELNNISRIFFHSLHQKKIPWEPMFSRDFVSVRLKVVLDHGCHNRGGHR
jgi:hypothetical protein